MSEKLLYFAPQDDITALELAIIYGHIASGPVDQEHLSPMSREIAFTDEVWSKLTPSIQRHFSAEPSKYRL